MADTCDKILLTGAGFSATWGLPLAQGMWALIFNHPQIHAFQNVKGKLLNSFDFEEVYHACMKSGSFAPDEQAAIQDAVEDAYEILDQLVRENFNPSGQGNTRETLVRFVRAMRRDTERLFWFTLNQDLLMERHLLDRWDGTLPGISQPFLGSDRSLNDNDFRTLPDQVTIDSSGKGWIEQPALYYIKLHGSHNWRSADGSRKMVIGRAKSDAIASEPLLAWNLALFEQQMRTPNCSLLVIGYGFGDEHINAILEQSLRHCGLKLYVVTPQSIAQFKEQVLKSVHGRTIYAGLSGYFPVTLDRLFPTSLVTTPEHRRLWESMTGSKVVFKL
jgi:hypothetical protein